MSSRIFLRLLKFKMVSFKASKHLRNHADELGQKILQVVDTFLTKNITHWQQPKMVRKDSHVLLL